MSEQLHTRASWWALIVLTATYTFSFIDRQIINLLVDPIRTDLSLSDSQVSFLQGLAFVLPYVILSIPLGRIVDRANRIRVLVIGILVWTVSCVTCGLAKNFWQLGVARMGVGAGEASVTPASWSLLADYFPEDQARAAGEHLSDGSVSRCGFVADSGRRGGGLGQWVGRH